jgi:hypothetical protein
MRVLLVSSHTIDESGGQKTETFLGLVVRVAFHTTGT